MKIKLNIKDKMPDFKKIRIPALLPPKLKEKLRGKLTDRVRRNLYRVLAAAGLLALLVLAVFFVYRNGSKINYNEVRSVEVAVQSVTGSGRLRSYVCQGRDGEIYSFDAEAREEFQVGSRRTIYQCRDSDMKLHYLLDRPEVAMPKETYHAKNENAPYRTYRAIIVTASEIREMGNGEKYMMTDAEGLKYLVPLKGKDLSPGDSTTLYMLYMKDGKRKLQFERPE